MGSVSSVPSGGGSESGSDSPDSAAAGAGDAAVPRTTRSHLMLLSRCSNKFGINLFLEFARDPKRTGNFVLFPLGVSVGLGMVFLGAKGSSRDEIFKAMDLKDVMEQHLLPAYAALHWDILRSTLPKGCFFEVAIQPFAPGDVVMSLEYEHHCTHYELTQIVNIDYQREKDRARKEINDWARQRTHGRVKDVLPIGVVDKDSHVVLVVAVYIKVWFQYPFPVASTSAMPFFLPGQGKDTPPSSVQMMYQQGRYKWASHPKLDCEVLELPFSNGHTKMMIYLPRKQDGINKIIKNFSRAHFEGIHPLLAEETVDVYLPKFRYELGHTTADKLQALGIKDLMTPGKAQLPGFEGKNNLCLSRCFHHIFFEVEEGAGSGAKTSNQTTKEELSSGDPKKIKTFKCDHPFLFIVKDERTGSIVIIGRVFRPMIL